MLTSTLAKLYQRDLEKLKDEIAAYRSDADLWETAQGTANSAGNLCQHLTGNLKHFIGAILGESGYIRDRDAEFSTKNSTRAELLADIDRTADVVKTTLAKIKEADLDATYPIEVFGEPMTTGYFLTHLTTHFNYHLGQINYHRRITSGDHK
jgi:uncharacterized damage-inducible protein DinB